MQAIENINLLSALDTTVSLIAAFIFWGLIGLERQYRQRTAGLRTNVLVAVGLLFLWIWPIVSVATKAQFMSQLMWCR